MGFDAPLSAESAPRSASLNRRWRLAATGLSFAVFGIGAVLLSLSVFPALRLVSWGEDRTRRRISRAMQLTMRVFVEFMRTLGLLTYEIRGRERLASAPRAGSPGRLIVANHPTLIDVVFLLAFTPGAGCVVKRQLWRNPLLRWPVLWAGYVPNGAGPELVRRCEMQLRRGQSLIVFPEGTRTVPGRPLQFKRGAAQIAVGAGAEVLPVEILCEPLTLTKAAPWYDIPAQRPHFTFTVGLPVAPGTGCEPGRPASVAARRLTAVLTAYFSEDLPSPHGSYERREPVHL